MILTDKWLDNYLTIQLYLALEKEFHSMILINPLLKFNKFYTQSNSKKKDYITNINTLNVYWIG